MLSADDRGRLERYLTEREAATGTQMAVAIFRSAEGENLEDTSIKLAEQWRIGQKGLDNGAILVVFLAERRVRLEVGYGLEPVIPDAVAAGIIRDAIAPRFREGRYAAGIEAAARAVYERAGEGKSAGARGRRNQQPNLPVVGFGVLLAIIVGMFAWETLSLQRRQRRLHYTLGSGGAYVPMGSRWGGPWFGGFGGGGFGGGGGGGGGGFSGGGGSFGGGGASGDW